MRGVRLHLLCLQLCVTDASQVTRLATTLIIMFLEQS